MTWRKLTQSSQDLTGMRLRADSKADDQTLMNMITIVST